MVKYRPYLGCSAFPQAAYTNSILTSRTKTYDTATDNKETACSNARVMTETKHCVPILRVP